MRTVIVIEGASKSDLPSSDSVGLSKTNFPYFNKQSQTVKLTSDKTKMSFVFSQYNSRYSTPPAVGCDRCLLVNMAREPKDT